MGPHALQFRLIGMLAVVAAVAVNFWLFRLGILWGILGLNVTKHVAIAVLCQRLGINRAAGAEAGGSLSAAAGQAASHARAVTSMT
jgi:hypothetical protein